jgi:hypothetical protein
LRFETHVRLGRTCSSHACTAEAAFGSRFCKSHELVYNMDNQQALSTCAAHADVAHQEGFSLQPAVDGAECPGDEAVKKASADADAWRRGRKPTATSGGTFLGLALVTLAAVGAHSTPPTVTTLAAVTRAQAGTPFSFHTNVVTTATAWNVPVIIEVPVGKIMYYMAVLPQAKDDRGHVGNYLETQVLELCPVADTLERAVEVLSAHPSIYTTALFGFRLRHTPQILEPNELKCQPPRTP